MEKSVREKTWVVLGRRDARTVEAISAAFVDSEAGNLVLSAGDHSSRVISLREEASILDPYTTTIIEEEDIDAHEPTAHRPDTIRCRTLRQGLQDGTQS